MIKRLFLVALTSLALGAALVIGPGGLTSDPPVAYAESDNEVGSACRNGGSHGTFSSTSDLQECSVGFYACIRPDSGFNSSISGLPIGTMGIIFQPWGADWYRTGGNNGYVQNVCNGTAGMTNTITLIPSDGSTGLADPSRPALDVRTLPFDQQLTLIQEFCDGKCRAEYFAYHALFLLGDGDNQQLWLSDQNELSRGSFEFVALTYYVSPGPITYNPGLLVNPGPTDTLVDDSMNASGYMYDMVNTIRTSPHDQWFEAGQDFVDEQRVDQSLDLAADIIRVFVL